MKRSKKASAIDDPCCSIDNETVETLMEEVNIVVAAKHKVEEREKLKFLATFKIY